MLLRWLRTLSLRTSAGLVVMGILSSGVPAFANISMNHWVSSAVVSAKETQTTERQANLHYRMAMKEIQAGNIEEGKQLLQQTLQIDPQHRKAQEELQNLADSGVSISVGTIAQADSQYDSLGAQQLMNMGLAKIDDGDFAGAQMLFEKALQKADTESMKKTVRSYLAAVGRELEMMDQVRSEVMDANLSELDKQLQKAAQYMEAGMLDEAERELFRASRIAPEDRRVNMMMAQLDKMQGTSDSRMMVAQQQERKLQASGQKQVADALFREGQDFYMQGLILEAVAKWNEALQVFPEHQASQTYLNNTRVEYEQAVAAKEAQEAFEAEEAEFESMLDQTIPQYSTQGERSDVKDIYSSLSNLSGLNFVLAENVEGQVAFDVADISIRDMLNLIQKQYGFIWSRDAGTVFVEAGFETRVFKLDEEQYKTLEAILNDPSVLEDSSRNLRTILYGPSEEFDVPGKQLFLNRFTQSLVVTDTPENLHAVEAFLDEMPRIAGDQKPIIYKLYNLEKDVARQIFRIVQIMLYGDQGGRDVTDPRRQLHLVEETNTLLVLDYPENIDLVEETLASEQFNAQLEEGELVAKEFQITDVDDVEDTPEALMRRQTFVNSINSVIESMLMGAEGRDRYALSGRKIIADPERGVITIVDTKDNIRKVEQYLSSVRGEATQDIIIKTFPIQYVDIYRITDAMGALFFDQQQSTRNRFISQNAFESIGTSEQGDTGNNAGDIFEETTRQIFNLTGGGGGGADLLQFFSLRIFPDTQNNTLIVITPDEDVLSIVERIINTFDKPIRQVQVEQRTVRVRLEDLRAINFDWLLTNPMRGEFDFDPDNFNNDIDLARGSATDTDARGVGFSLNTLGESRLDFVMNLLEQTSSAETLNSSKILSLSDPYQPPQVIVGQQVPYSDSLDFEDQGDDDPTNNRVAIDFERALVGSSFNFLPFILNDDSIYIELVPQLTSVIERLPLTPTGDANPDASVPSVGPLVLSQIFMTTGARVKDGDTIVIGGTVLEQETRSENKVPFLSRIPFLGALFRDVDVIKSKDTILTFVTVNIIEPDF